MGDWADAALGRLKATEGKTYEENQQRALDRQQIMADAPHLWNELASTFKQEIESFSEKRPDYLHMGDFRGGGDEFIALSSPEVTIEINFDAASPRLSYNAKKKLTDKSIGAGRYTFGILQGKVWPHDGASFQNIPSIASKILNHLI